MEVTNYLPIGSLYGIFTYLYYKQSTKYLGYFASPMYLMGHLNMANPELPSMETKHIPPIGTRKLIDSKAPWFKSLGFV